MNIRVRFTDDTGLIVKGSHFLVEGGSYVVKSSDNKRVAIFPVNHVISIAFDDIIIKSN